MKALTPVSTAETGTIGKEIDVEVKKDKNGMPYFAAKHIKGIFRSKVLEFRNALKKIENDKSNENKKEKSEAEKFVEKYFGSEGNHPSKIRFSDLKLKIEEEKNNEEKYRKVIKNKISNRYGIKINRKTRVAEENSLFNYEFVKTGNIYNGNFEINDDFFVENGNKENLEKNLKFLLSSFLHIDKVGGLKSRGLGKVEIRFTSVEIDGKDDPLEMRDDKFQNVQEILDKVLKNKPEKIKEKKLKGLKKYNYNLKFLEPVVLQGRLHTNEVELRNSLQGSSIRGAIIQYGLENGFKIDDLLKIEIAEVKKFVEKDGKEAKEDFKLASGFKTKYPVVEGNKSKNIDKAASLMKEYKVNKNDEYGIKLERDPLALLNEAKGTELSVRINEKTRTTEDTFLFSTEYVDLTDGKDKISFRGNVKIPDGLFDVDKKYELKIGKYKTKGFGKAEIVFGNYFEENKEIKDEINKRIDILYEKILEDFARIDKENKNKKECEKEKIHCEEEKLKNKEQKLITFDFLSDMILPFNEVSNVGKQILTLLEKSFQEKLHLNKRRTFVNVEKLRGYNIVNNIRKMDEIVITQGSVISYCVDEENVKGILEELAKIENEGIGLRRNEGFGRVRICSERKTEGEGNG